MGVCPVACQTLSLVQLPHTGDQTPALLGLLRSRVGLILDALETCSVSFLDKSLALRLARSAHDWLETPGRSPSAAEASVRLRILDNLLDQNVARCPVAEKAAHSSPGGSDLAPCEGPPRRSSVARPARSRSVAVLPTASDIRRCQMLMARKSSRSQANKKAPHSHAPSQRLRKKGGGRFELVKQ